MQTVVAVTLGGLIGRLPRSPVELFAGLMFLVGGVILLRGAGQADAEEARTEHEFEARARVGLHGWKVVGTSFLVLFLAEWGDLSQLLTAGLAARYSNPLSVFVGSWVALSAVAAIAVVVGNQLSQRLPFALIRRLAGILFAVLAVITLVEAIRSTR